MKRNRYKTGENERGVENAAEKRKPIISKSWAIFLAAVMFLFIVSFSIAVQIWFRPFYYMQIGPLEIVENSDGFTREQVITGFNQLMDYLNFGAPFAMGDFAYTESGKSHFEDCKVLFDLDTWVMLVSGAILIVAFALKKTNVIRADKLKGYDFYFFGGILGICIPFVLGIIILIAPDAAFSAFHKIFFPGKENWNFNWNNDQIIRILPFQFFMNCATLIGFLWLGLSAAAVIVARLKRKKEQNACELAKDEKNSGTGVSE